MKIKWTYDNPPEDINSIFYWVYHTREKFKKFDLSVKTIKNYTYDGFNDILKYFDSQNCNEYSEKILRDLIADSISKYQKNIIGRAKYQNIRKTCLMTIKLHDTGEIRWECIANSSFRNVNPEFEMMLSEYTEFQKKLEYLKDTTIHSYELDIRRFMRRLENNSIFSLRKVTFKEINSSLNDYAKQNPRSMERSLQALRSFANFMNESYPDYPNIISALNVTVPKHKKVYYGFTPEQIEKIFQRVDRNTDIGRRDYAIMLLAFSTGLRGCDIAALKYEDINWIKHEIYITQVKTEVPITVPLEKEVESAIAEYILKSRPESDSRIIFLRCIRPYIPLKSASMFSLVARYSLSAIGKQENIRHGLHSFRRGLGARMVNAEIPLSIISDTLGHTNENSTAPYVAVGLQQLKKCAGTFNGIPVIRKELMI